jgi:non-heme chloroperoxidase
MRPTLRSALLLAGVSVAGGIVVSRRRWGRADDPTGGRPLELPPGAEQRVRTGDGAALAVLDMGDRTQPPIVLAHGWTADRRVWAAVARRLVGEGRRVVVYDQRGHGASTLGWDGMTVEALGDDLCAVLEAVDARAAVIGGHSMGGMGAQLFALRHPDVLAQRVQGLVLISTAAAHVSSSEAAARATGLLMGSPAVQRAMASDAIGPFLVRSSHGRGVSLTALDATRRTWLGTKPEVRAGFLPALAGLDLTALLPTVTIPTVVVTGSRDTLLPSRRSRQIVRLVPGARLEVIPGAGHQLPFEAPDRLAAILAAAAGPIVGPSGVVPLVDSSGVVPDVGPSEAPAGCGGV